jgi:hypothetical protein
MDVVFGFQLRRGETCGGKWQDSGCSFIVGRRE